MVRIAAVRPINYLIEEERPVQVLVRDNNVDQALKALKKKMQREGIFREMKLRGHYEKPSEKRVREKAQAISRARKLAAIMHHPALFFGCIEQTSATNPMA